MDVKKLIRISEMVNDVKDQAGKAENKPRNKSPFVDAYNNMRSEAEEVLDEDLKTEFNSLIPKIDTWRHVDSALSQLQGYLQGIIKSESYDMQLKANAEAYAKEKIKEERGIGFKQ